MTTSLAPRICAPCDSSVGVLDGTDGSMLEVVDKGRSDGPRTTPLLFVHGAWHGAWCWDEHFLDYFADKGYRTLALSLSGHSNSPASKALHALSVADYVNDVRYVANSLPTEPVVIGHSMGGFVVQKYLESHDAPAGVLLAATPPQGMLRSTSRVARRHPWLYAKSALTRKSLCLVGTPTLAREAFFSPEMPEVRVAQYAARMQEESQRVFFDMLVLDLPRPKRVTAPLLVLGAEHDVMSSPKEVRATARAYGTDAEIFPGMAHNMMLGAGWAAVAERIVEWLATRNL